MDLHPFDVFPTEQELKARKRSERRFVWLFCSVAAIIGALVAAFVNVAIDREREAHARFMRQCMEDHKEYECTALWRGGSRSGPDVVVLPVPLPR